MGEKVNSPSSQRSSSAQHDTQDAVYDAQELNGAASGVAALDPNSPEYKELERRLVRKIDIRLMPITILLYILNYLDRNSISTARDNGLERDLGLKGQEYQTALSILYVGYITFQIPSNLFMTKLGRPSLYIPTFVTLWGVVSACTAATTGYHSLLAVRIILGAVESAFFPAALAMLSFFYRKNEMATRTALLFSGSIISNAFSGLISAGILSRMEGKAGLPAWKWLFIIEGAITVVVAAMAVFILPDMPENSKFLSVEERQMAVNRLKLDVGTSL
jgi:MFS family permease